MESKKNFIYIILILIQWNLCIAQSHIALDGDWAYRLDSADVGLEQRWFCQNFSDVLYLPGSLNTNGIGEKVSLDTHWTGKMWNNAWYESEEYAKYREDNNLKPVFWLTPDFYYVGRAWFQKIVEIPDEWQSKRIMLNLERCHWETKLWIDGKEIGTQNSLSVPHRYILENMTAGKHVITLSVDNRIKDIDPGADAHSISDNTQSNWNGIVGDISLSAVALSSIDHVDIFPDFEKREIKVKLKINSLVENSIRGNLCLHVKPVGRKGKQFKQKKQTVSLSSGVNELIVSYDMSDEFLLWDEFSPNLYALTVLLSTDWGIDEKTENFGLRKLGTKGTQITVNDRPIFLRGTLECCIFPKTGYPSTDEREWERIMQTCKKFGLNHIRFHSWCPPEAAFNVADRLGLYLYVECCSWANVGYGKPIDQFIMDESVRIVDEYGNHPSFCLFSYGNEPWGDNRESYLRDFVNFWKSRDSRFLYTTGAGWPAIDESDWISAGAPRIQRWGQGVKSVINAEKPNTDYDWVTEISKKQPTVSHEIGQWCVYPDLKERKLYTGVFKAKNFDIFEDRLKDNGLLHYADSFLLSSGKLQTLCYKADIEAALRTKSFGGFQLLDLHDFPGQGTATVGVLNAFWKEKGYVTAEEYKEFCNDVVPLARMKQLIYNDGDTLFAQIQVAQFSNSDITDKVLWKLVDSDGITIKSGGFEPQLIPTGSLSDIGFVRQCLKVEKPSQWQFVVTVGKYTNRWNIWIYPNSKVIKEDVLIADSLTDSVFHCLKKGGKVLLTPKLGLLRNEGKDSVVVGFSSIFWNTLWTNNQPPHTLGLLCNPKHSALTLFPTDYHSDYQWQYAMSHCNAIPLRSLKGVEPIVRIIDDWFTARSFALVVEMKVGKGKLLLCGADLLSGIKERPEAKQLLLSLLEYMKGPEFEPSEAVSEDVLRSLFK